MKVAPAAADVCCPTPERASLPEVAETAEVSDASVAVSKSVHVVSSEVAVLLPMLSVEGDDVMVSLSVQVVDNSLADSVCVVSSVQVVVSLPTTDEVMRVGPAVIVIVCFILACTFVSLVGWRKIC